MNSTDLQIEELATLPGRLLIGRLLARWHGAEWSHLYTDWDERAAEAEFAAMSRPGSIPTTWVAFAGLGRSPSDMMGSVSLALTDDLPGLEHLSPWLVSLYVEPARRGHQVAATLIDHLLGEARGMGIERVHLFTAGQERYYLDRGWRTIQYAQAHGHEAAVMVRHTDPRAARRAVCSQWISDPDFGGAYSYLRVGATPEDRHPLTGAVDRQTHPGLYLAGEAGSRHHPGTVHGAYFTGQDTAGLVLEEEPLLEVAPVVVIGAGVAGLAAARALHDAGRAVIVVEAKDGIGGRCHTDRSMGVPVHLGAAWLHGEQGHPLAALGANGPASNWEGSGQFILDHGPHDAGVAERAEDVLHQRLTEAAHHAYVPEGTVPTSTVLNGIIPEGTIGAVGEQDGEQDRDAAYGETAARLLDELARDPQLALQEHDLFLLQTWLRSEVESLYAAPWHDLSLRYGAEAYHLPGEDCLVSQPWDQLLAPMADGLTVRTATRVTAVRALARPGTARWRVELDPPEDRGEGSDRAIDHGSIDARSVIVTVPIGVLRSGRLGFEPPLPSTVLASLDRLGAGPVAKVCFRYEVPFWEPLRSFCLAGPEPLRFGVWFDVSMLAGQPTLCAFATGDDARWAEQASEDELCQAADELLRRCRVGRP
ncbi:MAG: GNAT family N-acetyltransferase [Acidimicrobiales bacterium]